MIKYNNKIMSCNDRKRFVPKQSIVAGTKATIPTSDNHQDGSWLTTDIYPGEIFINPIDGISWTRATIDDVDQIITIDGYTGFYEAILNQTSTNAPIPYNARGSLTGGTFARSAMGVYTYTLASSFPQSRVLIKHPQVGQATQSIKIEWTSVNVITIKTFTGGSAADDILTEFGIGIYILPSQNPAS